MSKVGKFLNRINKQQIDNKAINDARKDKLYDAGLEAGVTYLTAGTNKIPSKKHGGKVHNDSCGCNSCYKKGGTVTYDYIPKENIKELRALVKGESKIYLSKDILDGAYVKSTGKTQKTVTSEKLLSDILAYGRFHEEDKKEFDMVAKYIKLSDIRYFQKYLTNDIIIAFYCGVRASFEFKGDYEMSHLSGIFRLSEDYIKDFIDKGKEACKDKEFELGLKYPDYDFEKLLGKPKQTKIIKGKKNPNFYQYTYKVWIWDSCVAGKMVGAQKFKDGKKDGEYSDYTYGKGNASVELKMGYLGFVSSDSKVIDDILNLISSDSTGYVKDVEVIYNGLGGVTPEALKVSKIKFAKGGDVKMSKLKSMKKGETMKKQGYNDKLDESLSMTKGKASTKKQSDKDRRDESKGMEKAMSRRAYASVESMAKGGTIEERVFQTDKYGEVSVRNAMFDIDGTNLEEGIEIKGDDIELTEIMQYYDVDELNIEEVEELLEKYEGNELSMNDEDDYYTEEYAKGGKTQGYNDKLDESLGNTDGKKSTKKQSLKDRRDESKGEEKALGKRAYSSVSSMDKLLPFLSWHKK